MGEQEVTLTSRQKPSNYHGAFVAGAHNGDNFFVIWGQYGTAGDNVHFLCVLLGASKRKTQALETVFRIISFSVPKWWRVIGD